MKLTAKEKFNVVVYHARRFAILITASLSFLAIFLWGFANKVFPVVVAIWIYEHYLAP